MGWLVVPMLSAAPAVQPLPFHDDFDHHDNVGIIDSNLDNIGFGLNYDPQKNVFDSFVYDGREALKSADDWMIFPWFHFEQGLTYRLSMSVKCSGPGSADFECMLCKGDDDDDDLVVTGSAIKLCDTWKVQNSAVDTWEEFAVEFTPDVTGDYRFALHFISEARQKYHIDWITLGEGLTAASPAQATVQTPTYKVESGKLRVEMKVTPPAATHLGAPLPAELSARIVRSAPGVAEREFTLTGLAPSQQATFVDPDGIGTGAEYAVYIISGSARGVKKVVAAKPTFGYPKAPSNVVITHKGGTHFAASWDAVTASTSSSALFNPSTVNYKAALPDKTPLQLTFTGATSAEFDYPEPTESQVGAYISVYACNERGESTAGKSNSVVIGPALAGAFAESFANTKFQNETWSMSPATGAWALNGSGVSPHDGDKGMARYAQAAGKTGELISPILDLSGMIRAFVRMWVYKKPSSTLAATVLPVMRVYGSDEEYALSEPIDDHTLAADDPAPTENGWREYLMEVKMPSEKTQACNLVLKGTGAGSYTYIYVDDITIADYPVDTDLALTSIALPKRAEVGREATLTLLVTNTGLTGIDGFKVKASADGRELGEADGGSVERFGSTTLTYTYVPLPHESGRDVEMSFAIVCGADADADNNTCATALPVSRSLLPAPENLTVSMTDDDAALAWTTPAPGQSGMAEVNEDFEDWADGALNGEKDGWVFIDVDGLPTKGYGVDDPAYKSTLAAEIYAKGGAGGSRGLYVPGCYGENGALYGKPDKWIVLPEVVPGSEVSLSREAFNCFGKSSAVEIDYCTSAGGVTAADFDNVIDSETINSRDLAAAAVKTFTIPADASRFAIHVKDCQAKAVSFDNITYTTIAAPPMLRGYEVYCDGLLLTSSAPDVVSYNHVFAADETAPSHTYYVAAVYDRGVSGPGEIVEASKPSGAYDIGSDAQVYLDGLRLTVAVPGHATVCDISGRVISSTATPAQLDLPAKGLYIVRTPVGVVKLIAR